MAVLSDQIAKTLQPGMAIPQPLQQLFDWIEANDLYVDTAAGVRIGFLHPWEEMEECSTGFERAGGTMIDFFAEGNVNLKYWFRSEDPEILRRLCVFARTGGDGSLAAFWLDEDGSQKVVHLGSGSGSLLTCVLADDPVDFLRLLAIGYDEICWSENFNEPPNARHDMGEVFVHPNTAYQEWVVNTFFTTIPRTAAEIVRHPANMGDRSPDPFCRWVNEITARTTR